MRHLIDAEFDYAKQDFTKFMREKSRLPNRVTGSFVIDEGTGYLKLLLGGLIEDVLGNKTVSYEVDPEKVKKEIEQNQRLLENAAQKFVNRITSEEMIKEIPPLIRALLAVIAEEAEKYGLKDHIEPLVGNMLILRFVTPAIAIPEYYGTAPADCFPSSRARRNLVLVSKLIQALSNQVTPGSSEGFMSYFDSFYSKNIEDFKKYIHKVILDPKVHDVPEEKRTNKYGWDSFLTGFKEKNLDSIVISGNYTLRELAIAHRVLYANKDVIQKELEVIIKDEKRYKEIIEHMNNLLEILGSPVLIGPEPYIDPEHPEMKEYVAEKINKRGKRQQRIIKFTSNGFVNIKRAGTVQTTGAKMEGHARLQNEVLMREIKEYAISEHTAETGEERFYRITLTFDPDALITPKQPGYFPPSKPPGKRPPRVYDFTTRRTRDEVLGEMFELCFSPSERPQPVAFELTKVNKYGKAQTRVFKLSRDSLMNLKGQNIKTELHFSMIEYVRADPKDERSFYMKVRDEEFVRRNVCKDPESRAQLLTELGNGIQRFERE